MPGGHWSSHDVGERTEHGRGQGGCAARCTEPVHGKGTALPIMLGFVAAVRF
jgi:hypothetical protein